MMHKNLEIERVTNMTSSESNYSNTLEVNGISFQTLLMEIQLVQSST
jgi:hypothetical protein